MFTWINHRFNKMLIPFSNIVNSHLKHIKISGILHIGAHDCEELEDYENEGINKNDIVWIDAISEKVEESNLRGIPNVYQAVVSDNEGSVEFKITNNVQSSSFLDLELHTIEHPEVIISSSRNLQTTTLKKFFENKCLDTKKYNFWNLDIQGAELLALKGAGDILENVDAIFTEVNTKYLYKDCALINEIDEYLNKFRFVRVETFITQHGWGDALYVKRGGYVTPNVFENYAGLGNQLFTIAACFDYAKQSGREIVFLEDTMIGNHHSPSDPSPMILFPGITRLVKWWYPSLSSETILCGHFKYQPIRSSNVSLVKLDNYAQTPKYFENSKDEVRQLKNYLPNPGFELDYTNLAFIQVRRTDYVGNYDADLDKTNYWIKSVQDLVSKNPEVKIIVLSDDLEWSNEKIPEIIGKQYSWVFLPRQTTAMETLYIMSRCEIGGISANSSLGWWGCWLTPNRHIYMPVPWFRSTPKDLELYYEGVNKIDI